MSIREIGEGAGSGMGFLERVSVGLEPGCGAVAKFGYNDDIDSGVGFESIWGGGGDYTGFNATVAEPVQVFSSSADDGAAETGARTMRLYGLDAAGALIEEVVTLDGVAPVLSVQSFLRMPRARVLTAGSGGENAGVITVRQSVTQANVFAAIQPGVNRTLIAAYTVPSGKVGYLVSWGASAAKGGGNESQVRLLARPPGGVFEVLDLTAVIGTGTSSFHHGYDAWPRIEAMTDIQIIANASANNSGVSGDFHLILVEAS